MPFQSEKQRRFLHANHPEIAKRWEKEYAHGGILDINASEEIISDDGNDIELTDYNAAFDDPNDLSTGVKSLFQAKDGGTPRRRYFTGAYGGGGADSGNSGNSGNKGSPHSGGGWSPGVSHSGSPKSSPSSDRGPRDDPDRFGPVSKPQTVPDGINIHDDTGDEEEAYVMVDGQKVHESIWGTGADPRENPGREDLLRTYTQRMTDIQDEIKQKWRRKIDPTLWERIKDMPTLSFIGIISAIVKDMKDVREMKKDMEMLASLGLDKGHPSGTDTAFSNLQDYFAKRKLRKKDDDTGGGDGPPSILNPVTLEVGEEYAQGDYDFDSMNNWNAMKQKQALNAQLQEKWAAEQEAHDQSFLVANSGGLANLFRVKNNQ